MNHLLFCMLLWRRHRLCMSSSYILPNEYEDEDDEYILALILTHHDNFVPSRNRKAFYRLKSSATDEIPTSALLHPHQSAWRRLYSSGSDAALITLTGLDYAIFRALHEDFKVLFEMMTPHTENGMIRTKSKSGRKKLVQSFDCLGLVLSWTRTRGGMFVLQVIFGLSATTVSHYIRFGRRLLIEILKSNKQAEVKIPDVNKIQEYKRHVVSRHPALRNVWMTMDGVKLHIEQSQCFINQSRYYNSWTCDHYITNILGFCPAGTIVVACLNVPGSVHESMVCEWGNIYEQMDKV